MYSGVYPNPNPKHLSTAGLSSMMEDQQPKGSWICFRRTGEGVRWNSGSGCCRFSASTSFARTVIDACIDYLTECPPYVVRTHDPANTSTIRRHAILPPAAKIPSQPPSQSCDQQRRMPPIYLAPSRGCALEEFPCQELQATLHSRMPCA